MRKQQAILAVVLSLGTFSLLLTHEPAAQAGSGSVHTTTLAAQRAKPTPTPDLLVRSTIADSVDWTDPSSGITNPLWMQMRSDGAGSYSTTSTVESIIQGVSGDWILDTKNATPITRLVFLDFSKPVPGTGPNGGSPVAPFTSAVVPTRMISKCHLYNNDMFRMTAGSTVNCPLAVFFSVNGQEYFVHMNPVTGAYAFPDTDYCNVTCNSAANALCNGWTISASGAKGGCVTSDCSVKQNIAKLVLRAPQNGKSGGWTPVNQGNFYLAFSVAITAP